MNKVQLSAAAIAVLSVAGLVAGCGKDASKEDSPISFSQVTGDMFTSNPGAFQTDGVAVPPKDVMMVGDPVAAQAAVNAGLPQGTVTATNNNTTVYYPPAPEVPGLPVAPQPVVPEPLVRPANYIPWYYTPQQIVVYRTICETGSWNSWIAGVERQAQICWTLYGRRLGVLPWMPGMPRPWLQPGYPTPWFEPGFRADVPVMWVYPRGWTRPMPQPVISTSMTLNLGSNPYRRVNPGYTDPFYPVWAVTPGRAVDVRDQARIVAPVYTAAGANATAPVAPGVVLAALPASPKVEPILALPGAAVAGNANTNAAVTTPVAAALQGAPIQAGSVAALDAAVGTSVAATVASTARTAGTTAAAKTSGAATSGPAAPAASAGATSAAPTSGAAAPAVTTPATTPESATAPTGARIPTGARVAPTGPESTAPSGATDVQTTTAAPAPVQPTAPVAPSTRITPPRTTTATPAVPTTIATVPPTTTVPRPVPTRPVPTRTGPVQTGPVAPTTTTTVPRPVPTRTGAPGFPILQPGTRGG